MLKERPKRRLCKLGYPHKCIRRAGHPGDCVSPPPDECKDGNAVQVGGLFDSMRQRRLARERARDYGPDKDEPA